jgi:hypothetical protein
VKFLVVLGLFFSALAWPQSSTTFSGSYSRIWDVPGATAPTTSTLVTSAAIVDPMLDGGVISNTSASTQTVTITDNSTNCNGGHCQLPPITIAANSVYTIPMYGVRFIGGVRITATNANVVHYWLKGRY